MPADRVSVRLMLAGLSDDNGGGWGSTQIHIAYIGFLCERRECLAGYLCLTPSKPPLQPTPEQAAEMRRIEFIGDSDSNGFGTDGPVCGGRVGYTRWRRLLKTDVLLINIKQAFKLAHLARSHMQIAHAEYMAHAICRDNTNEFSLCGTVDVVSQHSKR